eukprot:scaffold893_cov336-Prasinococcus_capsulatus_cf.AAC.7
MAGSWDFLPLATPCKCAQLVIDWEIPSTPHPLLMGCFMPSTLKLAVCCWLKGFSCCTSGQEDILVASRPRAPGACRHRVRREWLCSHPAGRRTAAGAGRRATNEVAATLSSRCPAISSQLAQNSSSPRCCSGREVAHRWSGIVIMTIQLLHVGWSAVYRPTGRDESARGIRSRLHWNVIHKVIGILLIIWPIVQTWLGIHILRFDADNDKDEKSRQAWAIAAASTYSCILFAGWAYELYLYTKRVPVESWYYLDVKKPGMDTLEQDFMSLQGVDDWCAAVHDDLGMAFDANEQLQSTAQVSTWDSSLSGTQQAQAQGQVYNLRSNAAYAPDEA